MNGWVGLFYFPATVPGSEGKGFPTRTAVLRPRNRSGDDTKMWRMTIKDGWFLIFQPLKLSEFRDLMPFAKFETGVFLSQKKDQKWNQCIGDHPK